MNRFNHVKYYFFIDSKGLESVQTHLYGYAIESNGLYDDSNLEDTNPESFTGCGSYVYVKRDGNRIRIGQDFAGDYGIFVFRKGRYFAISNSFHMLVNHIKDHYRLTLNEDYVNQFLTTWIVSLAYSETAVNEIEKLPSHATITIDVNRKSMAVGYIDYRFNSIPLNSKQGIETLDSWYRKWVRIARGVGSDENRVQVDLSGGFDSRLTFLFFLNSGLELGKLPVYSMNDGLHTHSEDFDIVREMSSRYGFKVNEPPKHPRRINRYSKEDIANLSFYTKMMFHKELTFPTQQYAQRLFRFGGYGGETIRPYWDMPPKEFIKKQKKSASKLKADTAKRVKKSVGRTIKRSYEGITEKYGIEDPETNYYSFNMFRDCYSRNHFGRIDVEGFICNAPRLSPLVDPALHRLKLSDEACSDRNLLAAVVFTRFRKDLLGFRFDGNRGFEQGTLDYAEKITAAYPFNGNVELGKDDQTPFVIPQDEPSAQFESGGASRSEMESLFKSVFESEAFKQEYTEQFGMNLYEFAESFAENAPYFPMRHIHSAIAAAEIAHICKYGKRASTGNHYLWLKSYLEPNSEAKGGLLAAIRKLARK